MGEGREGGKEREGNSFVEEKKRNKSDGIRGGRTGERGQIQVLGGP
jgi:hypothetical protein